MDELLAERDRAVEGARQKAEFLANMSHEVRTPMNGVIGLTDLLLGTNLTPQQRDFAVSIRASADALLTVVNDILDFSKIEAGKLTFETLELDLQQTLEGAVEVLASGAAAKGLELGCVLAPGTPTALRGDPTRLRQILTNLIGNAVKFTERGEVMVRASLVSETANHAMLRFEVRDTGIGISKEGQEHLFQPFKQAHRSDTRRFGGTGLGLVISRQLAQLMGGEMGLESEPGRGSTFWFTLRLEKQMRSAPAPQKLAEGLTSTRVLIVDDNESNCRILQQHFSAWGLRSEYAVDGKRILEQMREQAAKNDAYRLVLLDTEMKAMDRLGLARQIKADPMLAGARLIALAPLSRPLSEPQLEQTGLAACLLKPVKQSRLFDCLVNVMEGARSAAAAAAAASAATGQLAKSKMRILLAEDNSINQKVALGQLQRLGCSADVVGTGTAVLKALENKSYDVILMDCQMPELDGYETTRRIRQREKEYSLSPVHIIAMTAHAMKGDREKCLKAGMDNYVSKPIRTDDLGRALEKCALVEPGTKESPPAAETIEKTELASSATEFGEGESGEPLVDTDWLFEAVGGVESEAQALAGCYLEQASQMLQRLSLAIGSLSLSEIEQVAHKLAGASASCGITALVGILRQLEQSAREGTLSATEAKRLYEEAQRRYQEVEQFLASCFAEVQHA
jgi:CheY-like chemotaxis protein